MAEQNRSRSVFAEIVIGIFVAVVAGLIVWKTTTPSSSSSAPLPFSAISQEVPAKALAETPKSGADGGQLSRTIAEPKSPPLAAHQLTTSETSTHESETASLAQPSPEGSVAYPVGTWRGTITQPDYGSYPVLMVLDSSRSGRFTLETLNCGGTVSLKESRDKAFFFSYEYEYGTNCVPGGTVKVEVRSENSLQVTVFRRSGELMSWGTLQRIDK